MQVQRTEMLRGPRGGMLHAKQVLKGPYKVMCT